MVNKNKQAEKDVAKAIHVAMLSCGYYYDIGYVQLVHTI